MRPVRGVLAALAFTFLAAASARAEDPPAGVLTRAPAVVEPATPEYPTEAKARGLSAEVTLELDVSEAGTVLAARVTKGAGDGFDEAALAAGRRLRFSPAELDGKPAAVTLEYRFRFEAPPPASAPAAAAGAVLRGVVVERGTRVPLGGVSVTCGEATTFSDREGRFELPGLPAGKVKVVAVDPGHLRFETEETLEQGKATEVRYYLRPAPQSAYEAVIVGERERKEVTSVTLTSGELTRIAGVSGDTVKVVQNLPGVARAPGGFGLLVVRGSNPTDTRVYLDGVEVPLVFHFGGLTSIVPSELVEAVDFEAGNFGVRDGRATGGLVNLRTKDPASRLHLVADANLYHALAFAEGPAGDRVTWALGARRSYADAVVNAAARQTDAFSVSVAPRYYDYQAKVTWKATPDDVVRFTLFGSDDKMVLTGIDAGMLELIDTFSLSTGFIQGGAAWDHRFSERTRAKVALAQSYIDISNRFGQFGNQRLQFHTTTLRAEASQDLPGAVTLATGLDARFFPVVKLRLVFPEIPPANQLPAPDPRKIRADFDVQGLEAGAWVEAIWKATDRLTVVPGVRVEHDVVLKDFDWVDPRLSVRYAVREGTVVKGAVGLYHQTPQPVYLTKQYGNPALGPEAATHAMVGVEQRVAGPVTADVQLYYKRLFDLTLPTDALTVRDGQVVPERYTNGGTGKAYGAEVLLRWNPGGRFFGWLAYSLSRSLRGQDVVGGTVMPGGESFDQPHNLTALGTLELPEVWSGLSAGFRARYVSGNPYVKAVGAVYDADSDSYQQVQDPTQKGRVPAFFQLDLRADKKWTFERWLLIAYLEVQNATNRKNPEDVAYNYDYSQRGWLTGLPLFPSFGLRAEY